MHYSGICCIKTLFNNVILQTRHFRTTQNANKVILYLQRAKLIDSIRLGLRSNSPDSLIPLLNSPGLDSFVVNSALQSAPSPDSALSLIETLKGVLHFQHTQNTLYTLAKILAKSGQIAKLEALINAINAGKFTNVARVSFMDRMRWYAIAGDVDEVVRIWDMWKAFQKQRLCTESYNIVMGLYAQKGKDVEAVKVFSRLVDEGALPNSRTYTVMIEHLVDSRKFDSALKIFRILPSMRIKRTLKQYSVLVRAFVRCDQLDVVKTLLDEMRFDGILPSRAMQQSLQCMKDAGFIQETDELIMEMMPDERIKSIGYSLNSTDNDIDDEEQEADHDDEDAVNEVQLKPWLDPSALASALQSWGPEEVSALEDAKFVWTTRLVCKMIRSFRSAETAWEFFCWVAYQPGFTHDIYTISRMITKLARHGCVRLVDQLLSKTQREGIRLSFSTVRLVIDSYGISGNGDAALEVFQKVKTVCGPLSHRSMFLLYSSLLRALAKCKMSAKALEILEEMILVGISPDMQTFSGLMNHFALKGDIKLVQRLFGMVRQSGFQPDAYMYKILIRAYCKCGRSVLALRLFEDMSRSSLTPDSTTKQLLVKSLWGEGKLREAAAVEEKFEEIGDSVPIALPGHAFTVSSSDLSQVCDIYSKSFAASGDQ